MVNWLCILNRINFEVVVREGIWGVSDRHSKNIFKTKPGEKCIFYLVGEGSGRDKKEPIIGGIYEIISKPYEDQSKIFSARPGESEIYPYRVKIKAIKLFKNGLSFKPLVERMSFITNKRNYGGHMLGKAMREISDDDLDIIINAKLI